MPCPGKPGAASGRGRRIPARGRGNGARRLRRESVDGGIEQRTDAVGQAAAAAPSPSRSSRWDWTEMYSPTAIENPPARSPAIPAMTMELGIFAGGAGHTHDPRQVADEAVCGAEDDRPHDAGASGFVRTRRSFAESLEPGGQGGCLRSQLRRVSSSSRSHASAIGRTSAFGGRSGPES